MTGHHTASVVDIHSHLVPGVDDGARDLAGTLDSVSRLVNLGVRRVVTTPHLQGSLSLDSSLLGDRLGEVDQAFEEATQAIAADFPMLEFLRGHEVLIDVPEPVLSDPRLRLAGTDFVLIEWPRLGIPPGTERVLRWIRDQGWRPVVAHPERYVGMLDRPDQAARWRDAGAHLQVNYGSLVGRYGKDAKTVAYRILEAGEADYMASDFHGKSGLKIYLSEARAAMAERGGSAVLHTLNSVNPGRLIEGLDPLPVPPLAPMGLLQRMTDLVGRIVSRRSSVG